MVISTRRVFCLGAFACRLAAYNKDEVLVVPVCLQWGSGLDYAIIHYGQSTASAIFHEIGIKLHWACAEASSIEIQFVSNVNERLSRDTLAYALPYAKKGARIVVFVERLLPFFDRDPKVSGRFLGHVLAHEIGHVLSGVAGHAEEGLMRAHWTSAECKYMRVKLLKFAKADEEMIRSNLRKPRHALAD